MKQSHIAKCISTVFCIAAILLPSMVQAQDPGPGPDAPIDGGLSLLIAAGVGYGVKKIREERKKPPTPKAE